MNADGADEGQDRRSSGDRHDERPTLLLSFIALLAVAIVWPDGFLAVALLATLLVVLATIGLIVRERRQARTQAPSRPKRRSPDRF